MIMQMKGNKVKNSRLFQYGDILVDTIDDERFVYSNETSDALDKLSELEPKRLKKVEE